MASTQAEVNVALMEGWRDFYKQLEQVGVDTAKLDALLDAWYIFDDIEDAVAECVVVKQEEYPASETYHK